MVLEEPSNLMPWSLCETSTLTMAMMTLEGFMLQLFTSLSRPQHLAIALPTLMAPLLLDALLNMRSSGLCLSCVDFVKVLTHIGLYFAATMSVAAAIWKDRTRVDAMVSQTRSELNSSIHHARGEIEGRIDGLGTEISTITQRMNNIERAMREELGIPLPVQIRANIPGPGGHLEPGVTKVGDVTPESMWGKFSRGWVNSVHRLGRWSRKIVLKWYGDEQGNEV